MRWNRADDVDIQRVRTAVQAIVESVRFDDWLDEVPGEVLVEVAAPLEVLTFHYYLDPPKDRHLVRAARVACRSVGGSLPRCPEDMADAFRELCGAVTSATR
jgi:hypothetical protein